MRNILLSGKNKNVTPALDEALSIMEASAPETTEFWLDMDQAGIVEYADENPIHWILIEIHED